MCESHFETLLREREIEHERQAPLGRFTTMRVGGPARWLVTPKSQEELSAVVMAARTEGLEVHILGGGANLLVRDEGVDGVVIRTSGMTWCRFEDDGVAGGAGVSFPRLVRESVARGLGGIESLCGIPGTLGGALVMNAGGRFGDLAPHVDWVDTLGDDGAIERLPGTAIAFGYRQSSLAGRVVVGGRLKLSSTDPEPLMSRYREVLTAKEATQPLSARSAGCLFKNPGGQSAGELIDRCGLKGFVVGGARVSEVHANFVVNDGAAKASDVIDLATAVRDRVFDRTKVELELEVKVW